MHLRDTIMQQLADAGVLRAKHARLQSFLKHVEEHPLDCLDEYIAVFREQYYDLFDLLVPHLAKVDDPMLRVALVRRADVTKAGEIAWLNRLVDVCDPVENRMTLAEIDRLGHSGLKKRVAERRRKHAEEEEKKKHAREAARLELLAAKRRETALAARRGLEEAETIETVPVREDEP